MQYAIGVDQQDAAAIRIDPQVDAALLIPILAVEMIQARNAKI
jgi:hypothetical protein